MTDTHPTDTQVDRKPLPELAGVVPAEGDRLQAFILLGGGLTPSPLTAATHCSVLDLLIGPGNTTVLDRWMQQVNTLNELAADDMPILIANGGGNPVPRLNTNGASRRVELVVDREAYRGAAGVVSDVSSHLDDEALILVAEAARCPDFDLAASVCRHVKNGFEATVLVNPDDTPAGIYLMARRLLKYVQREGYMDLKEQWLDKVIENHHRVGAHRISNGYARPLRTREHLLHAARVAATDSIGQHASLRFAATMPTHGQSGFRCISSDARVDESAVVVDSIVMPGASIGPSSIVTRSIVCENCRVPADTRLIDTVHGPDAEAGARSGASGAHREHSS